jgi:hypothetical protein
VTGLNALNGGVPSIGSAILFLVFNRVRAKDCIVNIDDLCLDKPYKFTVPIKLAIHDFYAFLESRNVCFLDKRLQSLTRLFLDPITSSKILKNLRLQRHVWVVDKGEIEEVLVLDNSMCKEAKTKQLSFRTVQRGEGLVQMSAERGEFLPA